MQAAHGVSYRDDRTEVEVADHLDGVGDELSPGFGGAAVRVAAVRPGVDADDPAVTGQPTVRQNGRRSLIHSRP